MKPNCTLLPAARRRRKFFFDEAARSSSILSMQPIPSALGTPEPSTWAMMLVGFAGLGFAGCRASRRRAAAAA
jgi:hypothetical protein